MRATRVGIGALACIIAIGISACSQKGKGDSVRLAVDFSRATTWTYDLSCVIRGSFDWPDSNTSIASELSCRLSGVRVPGEEGRIEVKAGNVVLKSNFLDGDDIDNVRHQIEGAVLPLRINGTMPLPEDSISLPMFGLGEWDIYRQLAKVAPALPNGTVRPGYTWERERRMPLTTSFGTAACNLYQSFVFDSLYVIADRRCAALSWRFRYSVETPQSDTGRILDNLPRAGNGEGHAVIDVDKRVLLSAEVDFVTPAAAFRDLNVRWDEKIRLMLVAE